MKVFRYLTLFFLGLTALIILLLIDLRYSIISFADLVFTFIEPAGFNYEKWITPILVFLLFANIITIASLSILRKTSAKKRMLILLPTFALIITPYLWMQSRWDIAHHPELLYVREGHCRSPLVSGMSGVLTPVLPLKARYVQFLYPDLCRVMQFRDAFLKNRASLCPKVGDEAEIECLKDWTRKISEKTPFTAASQFIMLSDSVMMIMAKKKAGLEFKTVAMSLFDLCMINIEAMKNRHNFQEKDSSNPAMGELDEQMTRAIQLEAASRLSEASKPEVPKPVTFSNFLEKVRAYWFLLRERR